VAAKENVYHAGTFPQFYMLCGDHYDPDQAVVSVHSVYSTMSAFYHATGRRTLNFLFNTRVQEYNLEMAYSSIGVNGLLLVYADYFHRRNF
jgi:hypothetical protein